MNLKYDDLLKMEKSFIKPVLEKIHKALTTIYEGKTIRVAGSDFDKNILFYVDRDLKRAKFEINEDKVKISNVEEIKVDVMSLKDQFQHTMSEAIDLVSAEKLVEAEVKFGEAVETLRKELAGDKVTIFEKRPPLLKESKVAIKKLQLAKENKIQIIKDMAANAKSLMESYFGKETPANEFEVNLTEGKTTQRSIAASSLTRNIDIAKKAAKSIDMKNIFEDVSKFISANEELFFLTSDKFKSKIMEAAKTNVAATKDKIDEAVNTFKKLRNESHSFRKIIKEVYGQAPAAGEVEDQEVPVSDKGMEDLDDKVVSDLDRKTEEDKLGFMKQFVDILGKLLEKIKEVSTDDPEVGRRVDFALDTIAKAKEEGRWDKDELSEIAKEAIELAAKIEGIQPEETEISKRSEEDTEGQEMDKATIDTEVPGEEIPAPEGEEEIVAEEAPVELSGEEDVEISPEGEVSYGDMDSEAGETPGEEFEEEEFEHLTCHECEKEFGIEADGQETYHCPYCGGDVGGFEDAEGTDIDADKPGAPDELVGGEVTPEEAPAAGVDEIAIGAIDPDNISENEMKTNPPAGKIEVAKPTEPEIKDTGEKMSTDPEVGTQDNAENSEEELPWTGKKMKKNAEKGKIKVAGGTKLPDTGEKMKTNATVGKQETAKPTEKELPDTGEKMKTNPPTGEIESAKTLKESMEEMFGVKSPKGCECGVEGCQYGIEEGYEPGVAKGDILATYRSKSNPDRRYYINKAKDGSVYCSCPAWKFQHKPAKDRTCKHCDDYKSGGTGKIVEEGGEEFIREGWTQPAPKEEGYPAIQQPAIPQNESRKKGFRKGKK